MKVVTIIGARPQFIKAAVVSHALVKAADAEEVIIHTGQHYDENMSDVFFEQLNIPKPVYHFGIGGLNHGAMTARMLEKIEEAIMKEQPNWVLVYGDTNSTLAGALAASKLNVPVAHVEAGLRSFNMEMPEEINRILTDRISELLFCPTDIAVKNLKKEGFNEFDCKIIRTGDVMYDAALLFEKYAATPDFDIPKNFILATVHRPVNTDEKEPLLTIVKALDEIHNSLLPVVMPVHPRTQKKLELHRIVPNFITIPAIGYLEMIHLLKKTSLVMTDSGGLQKEAYFFQKPCVTLRTETEWKELIKKKANTLANIEEKEIMEKTKKMLKRSINFDTTLFGDGKTSQKIVKYLKKHTK